MKINYVAIAVLTVASMIINMVWYGAFADPWVAMNGFTPEQLAEVEKNADFMPYIAALVASFVMYYVLNRVMIWAKADTVQKGLIVAVTIFVGFFFLHAMVKNMFSFREFGLLLIDEGVTLVELLVGGAVLGAWKKVDSTEEAYRKMEQMGA